jgi:hypothetical protein
MIKRCYLSLVLFLFVLATACCRSKTTPQPGVSTAQPGVSVALTDTPNLITIIPTPASDKCTITGVLLVEPGRQPVTSTLLALGGVVEKDGTPILARLEARSPRALTDGNGRFVFTDIPPGKYTLILDKIAETYLLDHPEDASDLLIIPEAGQVLDLGELVYSQLPISSP